MNNPCHGSYAATIDAIVDEYRSRYAQPDCVERAEVVHGRCQQFVKQLVAAHPELTAVAGFFGPADMVDERIPGDEHWWAVTPTGEIVDPTVEQFGGDEGVYTPWRRDYHYVYKGCCMNCSAPFLDLADAPHRVTCSEECGDVVAARFNTVYRA